MEEAEDEEEEEENTNEGKQGEEEGGLYKQRLAMMKICSGMSVKREKRRQKKELDGIREKWDPGQKSLKL